MSENKKIKNNTLRTQDLSELLRLGCNSLSLKQTKTTKSILRELITRIQDPISAFSEIHPQTQKDLVNFLFTAVKPPGAHLAIGQYILGYCYQSGFGIAQNHIQAAHWYRLSAKQGFAKAQFSLARCYAYGVGIPKNAQASLYWYQKVAENGYPIAYYYLGKFYAKGIVVPQNHKTAAKLFIRALIQTRGNRKIKKALKQYSALLKKIACEELALELINHLRIYANDNAYKAQIRNELDSLLIYYARENLMPKVFFYEKEIAKYMLEINRHLTNLLPFALHKMVTDYIDFDIPEEKTFEIKNKTCSTVFSDGLNSLYQYVYHRISFFSPSTATAQRNPVFLADLATEISEDTQKPQRPDR